jgi:hypothetical protein
MLVLNEQELRAKVKAHCGRRIEKGEPPCESCQKKLSMAKSIERQKDYAWRQHADWERQQRDRNKRELDRHA